MLRTPLRGILRALLGCLLEARALRAEISTSVLPQQWASSELGNTREQAAHVPHLPQPCASMHTQLRERRAAQCGGRKIRLGCEASAPLGGPSGP